jgi:ubiquinone/menaquinone biosynthesis C-methylase UbiE
MPDNTQRFTGRAADYDRYRQRYPAEEILAHLRAWCGLTSNWLVADIGAGTGMLAEVFLENGNPVIAIEPNADMRERARATFKDLGPCWPSIEIIDASAEATTLPAASIDLVAAGRAFHWFDQQRALAEFRRILKPGGWVTLVAVDRDRESKDPRYRPQIEAFEQLMATCGTDYALVRSVHHSYENLETIFDGELHRAQLPGFRKLDWPTFVGHTRSLSATPQPSDPTYPAFEQELRRYFDIYAQENVITLPTTCWINAARFAS